MIDNAYYFFGGTTLDEKGTRTLTKVNDKVWQFNFNTKKWKS